MKQTKPCPKCKQLAGWYDIIEQEIRRYYYPDGCKKGATHAPETGGKAKYCGHCHFNITDQVK